jgi:hypothetical protein
MLIARVLTKAKQRENGHDDHYQANEIDQSVHGFFLRVCPASGAREKVWREKKWGERKRFLMAKGRQTATGV